MIKPCFALAVMVLLFASAHPALAQNGGIGGTGAATGNAAPLVSDCHGYVGVTNKIAGCVLASLDHATGVYFAQFYPYISDIVAAVMVLGVLIYGVMVASHMVENVGRDTIMLLIKLAIVAFCVANSDLLYYTATDMMNAGGEAVVQVIPSSGNADGATINGAQSSFANVNCLNNMRNASYQNGKPVMGEWLAIDCMIDTVIGIKVPGADGNTNTDYANQKISSTRTGMSRGMIYFFASSMKSSIVGLMLGILGFMFMYSLIRLIITTLCVFLAGYLAVAIMMILSPIFIPLCLIPGETPRAYFDKWVKILIGFGMQPVLMMVFVTLYVSAMDLALFSSDYSLIYRIAGDASRQSGFDINQYIADHNAIITKPTQLMQIKTGADQPAMTAYKSSVLSAADLQVECGVKAKLEGKTEDPKCKNVQPLQIFHDSLDWEALASVRSPAVEDPGAEPGDKASMTAAERQGRQLSREVFSSAIFCAIMLFVMNRFAAFIPELVKNIVGSGAMPQQNVGLGNDPIAFLGRAGSSAGNNLSIGGG